MSKDLNIKLYNVYDDSFSSIIFIQQDRNTIADFLSLTWVSFSPFTNTYNNIIKLNNSDNNNAQLNNTL